MRYKWLIFLLVHSVSVFGEIQLEDDFGYVLHLSGPAQRVISLAPNITELVFASGAGEKLVGTVSYSDFPEAAKKVRQIGTSKQLSYESLVGLNPDLVLAWRSGNGSAVTNRLRSLGINVHESEMVILEDVPRTLRNYGVLLGSARQAELKAQEFVSKLETLRERYSTRVPVSVYYQLWNEPLLTLNKEHIISDVIRLCGGQNVFAESVALVSRISVETVIRKDPQVIIASGMGQVRLEWLDNWRYWSSMAAVTEDQLYFVPPDLIQRHTLRIIRGAEMLCDYLDRAREHYERSAK
tara:strand:+ start:292 stop:1179 length:888 start_codon:yes stop_codon:yes gene_type:complete